MLDAEGARADLVTAIAAGLGLSARFHRPSRAHQLLRGGRVIDAEFGRWVAREIPFVPDDQRRHLDTADDGGVAPTLVAWFVARYGDQRGVVP
jgi:hypothetical protein